MKPENVNDARSFSGSDERNSGSRCPPRRAFAFNQAQLVRPGLTQPEKEAFIASCIADNTPTPADRGSRDTENKKSRYGGLSSR